MPHEQLEQVVVHLALELCCKHPTKVVEMQSIPPQQLCNLGEVFACFAMWHCQHTQCWLLLVVVLALPLMIAIHKQSWHLLPFLLDSKVHVGSHNIAPLLKEDLAHLRICLVFEDTKPERQGKQPPNHAVL